MAKKKEKKDKKEKKEKKGKKGKRSEQQSEPRTAYDAAISTLGGGVCVYAVLTLLGIVSAVVLGVLGAM